MSMGVTLYGLRHRYGLMGIRNGVNLKLLSLCMGHVRTQMTEHYIAEAGLTTQVQQAAWRVAYGNGTVAGLASSKVREADFATGSASRPRPRRNLTPRRPARPLRNA